MRDYSPDEVAALSFHDSLLTGLTWQHDGKDLVLSLDWLPPQDSAIQCPKSKVPAVLACTYVSDFVVELDFGEFMGWPSIYELVLESLPHDRWSVRMEFRSNPSGQLRFECNDLKLSTIEQRVTSIT